MFSCGSVEDQEETCSSSGCSQKNINFIIVRVVEVVIVSITWLSQGLLINTEI